MADSTQIRFFRIPIYEKDIDNLVGFIARYELLEHYAIGELNKKLKDFAHPIHAVPGSLVVSDLMEKFIARSTHMFAVKDEHGGTSGVVTLEDAIETLIGTEIVDETDETDQVEEVDGIEDIDDMRELAKVKWADRQLKLSDNGEESAE